MLPQRHVSNGHQSDPLGRNVRLLEASKKDLREARGSQKIFTDLEMSRAENASGDAMQIRGYRERDRAMKRAASRTGYIPGFTEDSEYIRIR